MNPIHLPATTLPTVEVTGIGHYRSAHRNLTAGEHMLEIVAEPNNPHDNTAISVRHQGQVIGYIPAVETYKYWDSVISAQNQGKVALAKAKVTEDTYGNKSISLYLKSDPKPVSGAKNEGCMKPWMWFVLAFIVIALIF